MVARCGYWLPFWHFKSHPIRDRTVHLSRLLAGQLRVSPAEKRSSPTNRGTFVWVLLTCHLFWCYIMVCTSIISSGKRSVVYKRAHPMKWRYALGCWQATDDSMSGLDRSALKESTDMVSWYKGAESVEHHVIGVILVFWCCCSDMIKRGGSGTPT